MPRSAWVLFSSQFDAKREMSDNPQKWVTKKRRLFSDTFLYITLL